MAGARSATIPSLVGLVLLVAGRGAAAQQDDAPAGAAASAPAAPEVGIVVHAAAGAPAASDEVGQAVARAAAAGGARIELRPLSRARRALDRGAVAAARLRPFARVEELAAEGWRAYLEARPTTAASRLGEARALAAEVLDLPGGLALYADLAVRLGAVKLALGREAEAELDFQLAARLDPDRAVTDAEFKPAVVERHAAARMARPPRASLRIEVEPAGAAIELDGRPAGSAPIEVAVEAGLHVVVARAPGHAPRAEAVRLEPDAAGVTVAPLRIALAPDRRLAAAAAGPAALAIGRTEVGATAAGEALLYYGELDAIAVVAAVWRRRAPALLGQLCRGVPLRCGAVVEVGYPDARGLAPAATRLWQAMARGPARRPLTLLVDARLLEPDRSPGPAAPDQRPLWRNPWLWVGVSGVATVIAAGLLLSIDGDLEPRVTLDPCDFGGC